VRRTKEQAAETYHQIQQAAENLFLENGYDNVSLEDIAQLAGVTRGAVHWHFKNKQGLLFSLRDSAQKPFRLLEERLSDSNGTTSLKNLINAVSETLDRLEADPRQKGLLQAMMRLDLVFAEKRDADFSAFPEQMHAIFEKILIVVERDVGFVREWSPELAASMLNTCISGVITDWAFERGNFSLGKHGTLLIKTFLHGLLKRQVSFDA